MHFLPHRARTHVYEKTCYKFNLLVLSTRWRSHLVRFQGCTVDVRDTPIQTAATMLPSVSLCEVLAPTDGSVWCQFHGPGTLPLAKSNM